VPERDRRRLQLWLIADGIACILSVLVRRLGAVAVMKRYKHFSRSHGVEDDGGALPAPEGRRDLDNVASLDAETRGVLRVNFDVGVRRAGVENRGPPGLGAREGVFWTPMERIGGRRPSS
jgi:hypothetical protein